MRRGSGSRGSSFGMSRPFGNRPTYAGRRYINRKPRSGSSGSSDAEGLLLELICRGICCLIEEGYYSYQQQQYEENYNYNYKKTYTMPSSNPQKTPTHDSLKTSTSKQGINTTGSTTMSASGLITPEEKTKSNKLLVSSENCVKCGEKMLPEDEFCQKCGFKDYS